MKTFLKTLFFFLLVTQICYTQWFQTNGPGGDDIYSFAVSGTNLFAGTYGSGVFLSTNNGTSWTAVNSGLTNHYVYALAVSDTNLFAGGGDGVFLSTNNGTSWTAVNSGLTNPSVWALAVSGTNLFAGGAGGVFLSTNNGTSWTAVNSGLTNPYVRALVVSPAAGGIGGTNLFAGGWDGVFLSTNNGASWTAVNSGLTDTDVWALAVSGTNLFAGIYGIVWKRPLSEMIVPVELTSFTATANRKEVTLNWSTATELNNNGFEIQRKSLIGEFATVAFVKGQGTTTEKNEYSYTDKNLDAGKYSYRLKQVDLDGKYEYSNTIEVEVFTILSYSLEQNYPNPFNPTTTIGYVLQEKSNAKLTLLNSLGEEIAVLVNEEQDKGYHKVDFNASTLASGVYFYKLVANDFVSVKKMILVK